MRYKLLIGPVLVLLVLFVLSSCGLNPMSAYISVPDTPDMDIATLEPPASDTPEPTPPQSPESPESTEPLATESPEPTEPPLAEGLPTDDLIETVDTTPVTDEISIETMRFEEIDEANSIYVRIEYPRINGMADEKLQAEINLGLKEMGFRYYAEEDSGLSLENSYAFSLISSGILSVRFHTSFYHSGAAHPWQDMQAANIDLASGKQLKLSDVVELGDPFNALFKSGKFVSGWDSHENIIEFGRYDNWLNYIDGDDYGNFYLTVDSFGMIVYVAHAAGDFWTLEIPYEEIKDLFLL